METKKSETPASELETPEGRRRQLHPEPKSKGRKRPTSQVQDRQAERILSDLAFLSTVASRGLGEAYPQWGETSACVNLLNRMDTPTQHPRNIWAPRGPAQAALHLPLSAQGCPLLFAFGTPATCPQGPPRDAASLFAAPAASGWAPQQEGPVTSPPLGLRRGL